MGLMNYIIKILIYTNRKSDVNILKENILIKGELYDKRV
ncbi:protein of unknown function [Tepidibacter aestuarii]|nr:protein of unknown function [Tepidibacter aestuarii]